MATSPFVNEINYCFFHSNIIYINAITATQTAIINNTPNNLGNMTNIAINITNIKNIQMDLASIIGSMPPIFKLIT